MSHFIIPILSSVETKVAINIQQVEYVYKTIFVGSLWATIHSHECIYCYCRRTNELVRI